MLGLLSGIQKQIPLAPLIDYLTEDRLQQYGIPLPSYKAMPLLLHRNWAFSALMPPFPAIASISHEHPHILSQVWGWGIPLHAHQWKTLVWKTYVFFFDPQKSEIKPHTSQHPPANAGDVRDVGSIPGSGRFPGGGHGNHSSILAWRIPGQRSLAAYGS